MNLVEKHIISPGSEFFAEAERVSFLSKNLYNYANYIVRQEFIKTSKEKELRKRTFAIYLNYHEIRKMLQGQVDYIALPGVPLGIYYQGLIRRMGPAIF